MQRDRSRAGSLPHPRSSIRLAIHGALLAAAVLLPLVLSPLPIHFVRTFGGDLERPFGWFAFTGSLALMLMALVEARHRGLRDATAWLPVALGLAVGFHVLGLIVELAQKRFDWRCYEEAAVWLTTGGNPYANLRYLYPPTLAEALAVAHSGIAAALGLDPVQAWNRVFYLHQAVQVPLVLLAFGLLRRLAGDVGLGRHQGSVLAAALLLVNTPLVRTIECGQVNLWVLDCVLIAIVLRGRSPVWAGVAVAVGGAIKLYPLALLGPWLLTRQWRACLGAVVGGILLLVLQVVGFGLGPWQQYLASMSAFRQGLFFRDNGLHAVLFNLWSAAAGLGAPPPRRAAVLTLYAIGAAAVAALLAARVWQRERLSVRGPRTDPSDAAWARAESLRHHGHAADALALGLIVAPMVWEHHYLLALPIVAWAAGACARSRRVLLGAAALAMLAVPTFEVFFWSWHRLAGLVALLALTPPRTPSPHHQP